MEMSYKKGMLTALPALLISLGALSSAHASGYAVFTHGAAALGQGNAVTAHTQSPSTIFYNPALMNKLDGTQLEIGTTAIVSSHQFDSNQAGGSSTSNDSTFFPSTFYATHKFNDSLSAGLGVFNPFGLGTDWGTSWDGRYLATKSKLTTFDINPVVSYRIIPSLAVAVGLDVILLDATLERNIPPNVLRPTADTGQKFKGDGTGVGYNLALAYDINKDLTFGASYRSSTFVKVKGDSSTSPSLPLIGLNSNGSANIRLPQQATAAISYQVSAPLIIEAGVRWEGWSAFKELQLSLDNNTPLSATARNWHDTFGANLGGKYRLNDNVALMAGYVFGNSAAPDSTFDPSIPDATTHVFCVGTDLSFQQFKIALSYAYQLYVDRTKGDNLAGASASAPFNANGTYQSDAHLIAVSLGYKF
jgi:long-chain fatty acid transport protein